MSIELFKLKFLTFIYLNQNNLRYVPPQIGELTELTLIDLSHNKLQTLPPELGKLRKLREVLLFNNQLQTLPFELGGLFQVQEEREAPCHPTRAHRIMFLTAHRSPLRTAPEAVGRMLRSATIADRSLRLGVKIHTLGLHGNPLAEPLRTYSLDGTEVGLLSPVILL